jgi:hypothetical protein
VQIYIRIQPALNSLQITDCPGYNDQNTAVAAGSYTVNQHAAERLYFGPSVITWYNSTGIFPTITLNGTPYGSNFGSIYLSPLDVFQFDIPPATISWIGK